MLLWTINCSLIFQISIMHLCVTFKLVINWMITFVPNVKYFGLVHWWNYEFDMNSMSFLQILFVAKQRLLGFIENWNFNSQLSLVATLATTENPFQILIIIFKSFRFTFPTVTSAPFILMLSESWFLSLNWISRTTRNFIFWLLNSQKWCHHVISQKCWWSKHSDHPIVASRVVTKNH